MIDISISVRVSWIAFVAPITIRMASPALALMSFAAFTSNCLRPGGERGINFRKWKIARPASQGLGAEPSARTKRPLWRLSAYSVSVAIVKRIRSARAPLMQGGRDL